jgi:PPM family protein phosphatase
MVANAGAQMIHVRVTAATHRGLVRERNEDAVAVAGWLGWGDPGPVQVVCAKQPFCVLVSDGMGGHAGGDAASQIAVTSMSATLSLGGGEQAVRKAVAVADLRMVENARAHLALAGMGATVAGVLVEGDTAWCFNVGDSTIFRVADGFLGRLSVADRPPTLPGQPAGARVTTVTQSLGSGAGANLDPHTYELPLAIGMRILICSDGLTDYVAKDQVTTVLNFSESSIDAVARLIGLALDVGAPDNVTVALLDVEG